MSGGDLSGRTALIVGGSRGIGLATGQALAARGADVVLTSRRQEAADEAAALVGSTAAGYEAHAADEQAARRCIEFVAERFGGIDILVNNAGTNPAFGQLVDQEAAPFMKTFEINVWTPVLWAGLAWRAWMAEHGGTVVNTASLGGFVVDPGMGVYSASKAALIHLTRHMALEMAPRVRVNAVAPGLVRTRLAEKLWLGREEAVVEGTPLARIGEPEDIAAAIAFLAGDESSWVTGETLVVDGGQFLAKPPVTD